MNNNMLTDLMRQTKFDQLKRVGMTRTGFGGKTNSSGMRNTSAVFEGVTSLQSMNGTTAFSIT